MRTTSTFFLILFSLNCRAQEENTLSDTASFVLVSEALFGCECYNLPDTFNFGLPRPLDNDFFMIDEFNNYLTKRYDIDETYCAIGILYQVAPEPKGELLKNIWVEISFSSGVLESSADYYSYIAITLPLCAIEVLYKSSGSEAINTELRKALEFSVRREKKYWDGSSDK